MECFECELCNRVFHYRMGYEIHNDGLAHRESVITRQYNVEQLNTGETIGSRDSVGQSDHDVNAEPADRRVVSVQSEFDLSERTTSSESLPEAAVDHEAEEFTDTEREYESRNVVKVSNVDEAESGSSSVLSVCDENDSSESRNQKFGRHHKRNVLKKLRKTERRLAAVLDLKRLRENQPNVDEVNSSKNSAVKNNISDVSDTVAIKDDMESDLEQSLSKRSVSVLETDSRNVETLNNDCSNNKKSVRCANLGERNIFEYVLSNDCPTFGSNTANNECAPVDLSSCKDNMAERGEDVVTCNAGSDERLCDRSVTRLLQSESVLSNDSGSEYDDVKHLEYNDIRRLVRNDHPRTTAHSVDTDQCKSDDMSVELNESSAVHSSNENNHNEHVDHSSVTEGSRKLPFVRKRNLGNMIIYGRSKNISTINQESSVQSSECSGLKPLPSLEQLFSSTDTSYKAMYDIMLNGTNAHLNTGSIPVDVLLKAFDSLSSADRNKITSALSFTSGNTSSNAHSTDSGSNSNINVILACFESLSASDKQKITSAFSNVDHTQIMSPDENLNAENRLQTQTEKFITLPSCRNLFMELSRHSSELKKTCSSTSALENSVLTVPHMDNELGKSRENEICDNTSESDMSLAEMLQNKDFRLDEELKKFKKQKLTALLECLDALIDCVQIEDPALSAEMSGLVAALKREAETGRLNEDVLIESVEKIIKDYSYLVESAESRISKLSSSSEAKPTNISHSVSSMNSDSVQTESLGADRVQSSAQDTLESACSPALAEVLRTLYNGSVSDWSEYLNDKEFVAVAEQMVQDFLRSAHDKDVDVVSNRHALVESSDSGVVCGVDDENTDNSDCEIVLHTDNKEHKSKQARRRHRSNSHEGKSITPCKNDKNSKSEQNDSVDLSNLSLDDLEKLKNELKILIQSSPQKSSSRKSDSKPEVKKLKQDLKHDDKMRNKHIDLNDCGATRKCNNSMSGKIKLICRDDKLTDESINESRKSVKESLSSRRITKLKLPDENGIKKKQYYYEKSIDNNYVNKIKKRQLCNGKDAKKLSSSSLSSEIMKRGKEIFTLKKEKEKYMSRHKISKAAKEKLTTVESENSGTTKDTLAITELGNKPSRISSEDKGANSHKTSQKKVSRSPDSDCLVISRQSDSTDTELIDLISSSDETEEMTIECNGTKEKNLKSNNTKNNSVGSSTPNIRKKNDTILIQENNTDKRNKSKNADTCSIQSSTPTHESRNLSSHLASKTSLSLKKSENSNTLKFELQKYKQQRSSSDKSLPIENFNKHKSNLSTSKNVIHCTDLEKHEHNSAQKSSSTNNSHQVMKSNEKSSQSKSSSSKIICADPSKSGSKESLSLSTSSVKNSNHDAAHSSSKDVSNSTSCRISSSKKNLNSLFGDLLKRSPRGRVSTDTCQSDEHVSNHDLINKSNRHNKSSRAPRSRSSSMEWGQLSTSPSACSHTSSDLHGRVRSGERSRDRRVKLSKHLKSDQRGSTDQKRLRSNSRDELDRSQDRNAVKRNSRDRDRRYESRYYSNSRERDSVGVNSQGYFSKDSSYRMTGYRESGRRCSRDSVSRERSDRLRRYSTSRDRWSNDRSTSRRRYRSRSSSLHNNRFRYYSNSRSRSRVSMTPRESFRARRSRSRSGSFSRTGSPARVRRRYSDCRSRSNSFRYPSPEYERRVNGFLDRNRINRESEMLLRSKNTSSYTSADNCKGPQLNVYDKNHIEAVHADRMTIMNSSSEIRQYNGHQEVMIQRVSNVSYFTPHPQHVIPPRELPMGPQLLMAPRYARPVMCHLVPVVPPPTNQLSFVPCVVPNGQLVPVRSFNSYNPEIGRNMLMPPVGGRGGLDVPFSGSHLMSRDNCAYVRDVNTPILDEVNTIPSFISRR